VRCPLRRRSKLSEADDSCDPRKVYEKAGFQILIHFHEGRAVLLWCSKHGSDLSSTEIETLLQANAAGSTWEIGNSIAGAKETIWHREDGKRFAQYMKTQKIFSISSPEFKQLKAKFDADQEKKNLEGF